MSFMEVVELLRNIESKLEVIEKKQDLIIEKIQDINKLNNYWGNTNEK